MKTENVTAAKVLGDQTFELTSTDPLTGTETKKRYQDIRGGLSWPTTRAGAYLCIVGQEYVRPGNFIHNDEEDNTEGGKRILLAEHEDKTLSMDRFYEKIIDLAEQMGCKEFYTELPEDRYSCGYLSDFDRITRGGKSRVLISAAYDADNFLLGASRIRSRLNTGELIIPDDSIIYAQLSDITRDDLEDMPEQRFHAINGMRHVVGSFCRYPPVVRSGRRVFNMDAPNWRAF
jgi:hypothetical protein